MTKKITHEFVKAIPDDIKNDVLYISIDYTTAVHRCFCGCGSEVTTPLTPTDWKLIYDGKNVSLYPSVGSWNLDCKSHYWIESDEVHWARKWTEKEIETAQHQDANTKEKYYSKSNPNNNWEEKIVLSKIKKFMNWF
jgi:hypothetical protein